ncbi:GNAT family N-acetyltransferase, partial [Mesorhizobium sp. M7A.F.Ca.US.001.02.1.1]
ADNYGPAQSGIAALILERMLTA